MARVSIFRDWVSGRLKYIHAGADYPGYYSDMDFLSGSLAIPLWTKLRLRGDFRREERNLDLDPALFSAPLERFYRVGLDYRFRPGARLSVDYRNRRREDRLPIPNFDYVEETVGLETAYSFKKLSLSLAGEWGQIRDYLNEQSSDAQKYRISCSFRPTRTRSYSGYLDYYNDASLGGEERRNIYAGLSGSFHLTNRTSFVMDVRVSNKGYELFETSVDHVFAGGSKFSVLGRYTSYGDLSDNDSMAVMVEYSIPIGLPIGRKTSVGAIKGNVYDEETGFAIRNVLLTLNGATAVSDGKGNFVFPSLKPGRYFLGVDATIIGLDKITVRKTPRAIAVKGGEETKLAIGITRCARLAGRVVVYRDRNNHMEKNGNGNGNGLGPRNGDDKPASINNDNSAHGSETEYVESYGLANVLVEITNGSEKQRRVTDSKGYFDFERLRPSQWNLKVYDNNLPEYHGLEKGAFGFRLKPGEQKTVDIRVLPRKRPVQIIENGGILLEEKKN